MIWDSYLVLADDLVDQEFEAWKRSGISRAYYGAFNRARRWLEAHGMPVDNHRAHDRVWRTFRAAAHATSDTRTKWQMVGLSGGELFGLRNQADYADAMPRLDRQAIDAVASAVRIVALLDELEFVD